MRPNLLLWLSSFVIISSTLCIFFTLQRQSNQEQKRVPDSWHSYSNSYLGLSLKFPPEWISYSPAPGSVNLEPRSSTVLKKEPYDTLAPYVYIYEQKNKPDVPFKPILVNNLQGFVSDRMPSGPWGSLVYMFPRGNDIYLIVGFSPFDEKNPSEVQRINHPLFLNILSTLSLTPRTGGCYYEESGLVCPELDSKYWKTNIAPDNLFSISYPDDWVDLSLIKRSGYNLYTSIGYSSFGYGLEITNAWDSYGHDYPRVKISYDSVLKELKEKSDSISNITISGYPAFRALRMPSDLPGELVVLLRDPNNKDAYWSIGTMINDDNFLKNYIDLMDQIFLTFKFTNL